MAKIRGVSKVTITVKHPVVRACRKERAGKDSYPPRSIIGNEGEIRRMNGALFCPPQPRSLFSDTCGESESGVPLAALKALSHRGALGTLGEGTLSAHCV